MIYLFFLFILNTSYAINASPILSDVTIQETIYKNTDKLRNDSLYIANLIFNGFENEKIDTVHEKVVAIEDSLNALKESQKELQKESNVTALEKVLYDNIFKSEIISELSQMLEVLMIGNNYINSNETLPNDATAKELLRNLYDRLNYINEQNKQLQLNGVDPIPDLILEVMEWRVLLLDLVDSNYYIIMLIYKGTLNDSVYEIHQKVASIEGAVNNLKWVEQKTMIPSFESQINATMPKFEMLLDLSKLMENFELFVKNVFSNTNEAATPFFMGKVTDFLNNMKHQLAIVYDLNEQFRQQGITPLSEEVIKIIEQRLNASVILLDFRNFYNVIFNKTIENLTIKEKEKIYEIMVQIERDYDASDVNNTFTNASFSLVEYTKLVYEFASFYDYFEVDDNGELVAEITPDVIKAMNKIVDSLKERVKHIKSADQFPSNGEFAPLFAELYFETVSLNNDPKRNPARALYLINEMDNQIEIIFNGTTTAEQQQGLHKVLMKAKEDTLSGQKDFYKSILLALVEYKHYL
uniref:Uncharacterized protein n=1 Tax=Acrobeloides nanus TaxID=290746 RepID=A0A914E803_9BILA